MSLRVKIWVCLLEMQQTEIEIKENKNIHLKKVDSQKIIASKRVYLPTHAVNLLYFALLIKSLVIIK